ncbi:MAG: lysophospholipid acyltransferase family protein [Isosphaeraceae bacterium]
MTADEPALKVSQTSAVPFPKRSAAVFAWFRWYARRYVAKRFHAVRLSRAGYAAGGRQPEGPVVVVVNHPAWWDPMIGLVLSDLWPDRVHVAPIDSAALARYGFFERVGFFGVEPGTARGGREFLRRSLSALADPNAMLWVTAQGRFADVRERPVALKEGVGHLAARLSRGHVLPLALEYSFWEESLPEAFARFGSPLPLTAAGGTPGTWTDRIARALEETQDALAADVTSRDPSRFECLVAGGAGVGGVYDLWRRAKAAARGRRFDSGHGRGIAATNDPS